MPCSLNAAASRWPGGSSTSAGRCEGPPRRSKCHRRPPPGGPPIIPFAHGLNSQNLMRVINMPAFLIQGNEWVGGWRVGWPALAGNPQNIPEDLGGSVDTMLKFMGILKDGSEKLATV